MYRIGNSNIVQKFTQNLDQYYMLKSGFQLFCYCCCNDFVL